ncbi:MAG: hypothetical protein ACO3A2_07215 [Bdellovibrionia bacterium]
MLQIIKKQQGDTLVVRLIGAIEENAGFERELGSPPAALDIYCKEVSRINSDGVRSWIKYFQKCQSTKTRLRFFECSPSVVDQMNLISNFISHGTVESLFVPFVCKKCHAEFLALFQSNEIQKSGSKIPKMKCKKCSGEAEFDDVPEKYFSFLFRKK